MSADLTNWCQSPHHEWAFHNVDKLLTAQPVKKYHVETAVLDKELRSFDDFKLQISPHASLNLPDFLAATNTDGFVVLHNGKTVYESYDHDNNAQSKHIMMSITKSVVGLITGILASQGKINVHSLVKEYVPEASSVYDNVTIQQCLDMTSGVVFGLEDDNQEYRAASGWQPLRRDAAVDNLHDFIAHFKAPTNGPGSGFNYNSVNTDVLGWALERASGKKLAELISELLWQPMGAENDALLTVDKDGNGRAAGGLCASVRDVARVGQLVADGGHGIVPSTWIEDMLYNGDKAAFARGAWKAFEGAAYRDCWIGHSSTKALIALGIHGQMLAVDQTNNVVMAKTSSQEDRSDVTKLRMTLLAFEEFIRILSR